MYGYRGLCCERSRDEVLKGQSIQTSESGCPYSRRTCAETPSDLPLFDMSARLRQPVSDPVSAGSCPDTMCSRSSRPLAQLCARPTRLRPAADAGRYGSVELPCKQHITASTAPCRDPLLGTLSACRRVGKNHRPSRSAPSATWAKRPRWRLGCEAGALPLIHLSPGSLLSIARSLRCDCASIRLASVVPPKRCKEVSHRVGSKFGWVAMLTCCEEAGAEMFDDLV